MGWCFRRNMTMVYNSKMKEAIKAGGCNTAGDASGALDGAVAAAVAAAVARCGANGRKTVRSHDIHAGGNSGSGMVVASRVKEAFKAAFVKSGAMKDFQEALDRFISGGGMENAVKLILPPYNIYTGTKFSVLLKYYKNHRFSKKISKLSLFCRSILIKLKTYLHG